MDSSKNEMKEVFERAYIAALSLDELQEECKIVLGKMFKENLDNLIIKDMEKAKNAQYT